MKQNKYVKSFTKFVNENKEETLNEASFASKFKGTLMLDSYTCISYEESYENGEGRGFNSFGEDVGKIFSTFDELIKYIAMNILYADKEFERVDSYYFEDGLLGTSILTDANNDYVSQKDSDYQKWVDGKITLYTAHYTFKIYKITEIK